jgi:peptidyl-prolyl cis-trans isomerase-like protein 2
VRRGEGARLAEADSRVHQSHGKNPVTGAPLAPKDLIRLNFHQNQQGQWCCPVTYKVFGPFSHIVAVRPSGNVYLKEAVDRLNVKANHWEDLVSGEKFTAADVITIQGPDHPPLTSAMGDAAAQEALRPTLKKNDMIEKILQQLPAEGGAAAASSSSSSSSSSALKRPRDGDDAAPAAKRPLSRYSDGRAAGSLTSTTLAPETELRRAELTDDQIREQLYNHMRDSGRKALLSIETSLGTRPCARALVKERLTRLARRRSQHADRLRPRATHRSQLYHAVQTG